MAQRGVYFLRQLTNKIPLLPNQLNSDIDDSLLSTLRKLEGRVDKNGLIIRINRIIRYDNGVVDRSTLSGLINVNVEHECLICSPTVNSEMIAQVENFITGFILCRNGPMVIAIELNQIDKSKFNVNGNKITEIITKKTIEVNTLLRLSIINCKMQLGNTEIYVICKIINLASKNDEETFKQEQNNIMGHTNSADDIFYLMMF